MPQNNTIIGLDIGSHTIRALWVDQRSGKPKVTRREELRLPASVPNLQRVVSPWIESHGLHKLHCTIGMSGHECVFQPMMLAADDPRTPDQAASIEVAKFNEMASELMNFDVTSFGSAESSKHLLIAMARPDFVTKQLNDARKLGVERVMDLIPRPFALYRAATSLIPADPYPTIFVHVGHAGTELAVGLSEGILFARSFSCGGRMFTEAMARASGQSIIQAENRKADGKLNEDGTLPQELQEVTDFWLTEFNSCLAVYNSLFSGEEYKIGRVVLSGGGARLQGFSDKLRERIDHPIHLIEELAPNLPCEPDDLIALGTAICSVKAQSSDAVLSLMPPRLKDEMVFRREKPYWIASGVMAGLSLLVFMISAVRMFNKQKDEYDAQLQYQKRIEETINKINRTHEQRERFHIRSGQVQSLMVAAPKMREVIRLVANSIHPDDWISMVSDAETYFTSPKPKEPKPDKKRLNMHEMRRPRRVTEKKDPTVPKSSLFNRFIIEGYTPTRSLLTIKDLIRNLKKSEFVEEADLLADNLLIGTRWQGTRPITNLTQFVIEIKTRGL